VSELPSTFKRVTVWLLAGTVLFLAVQAWLAEQQKTRFQVQGSVIELRRGSDGHYHWPGTINGHAVDFLIDTGATSTAVPQALAQRLGLQPLGRIHSSTAGGSVTGTVSQADLRLEGGLTVTQLKIVALPALDSPLLGMDVLGRVSWQQGDGVLRIDLRKPG
jgi:aspartyl protease family protein